MVSPALSREAILERLRSVKYPGFSRDIVSFGVLKDVRLDGANVSLELLLPTQDPAVIAKVQAAVQEALTAMTGVGEVHIQAQLRPVPRDAAPGPSPIPGVRRIIAVASGKGGVGKTTVAVNLALALVRTEATVGLLDADIYGPNVPLMLGAPGQPVGENGKILPLERYGLQVMSVGYLLGDRSPVIWRGPLVAQAVRQLLHEVRWGDLDYLIVDLPPGTGDAQLTLVQSVPLTGGVIVTTPSGVALLDAEKGLRMFGKVNVPVLGIVENMSYFTCPHCQQETDIFSRGGGLEVSEILGIPFLGEIPLDPAIRKGGDTGAPVVAVAPESAEARPFRDLADKVRGAAEVVAPALPEMIVR